MGDVFVVLEKPPVRIKFLSDIFKSEFPNPQPTIYGVYEDESDAAKDSNRWYVPCEVTGSAIDQDKSSLIEVYYLRASDNQDVEARPRPSFLYQADR